MDELIPQQGYLEIDGEMHDALLFSIDQSYRDGILQITDEVNLAYDTVSGAWKGDAVRVDGWYDLDESEVEEIVDRLGLDAIVADHIW